VRILDESGPTPESVVTEHVALPTWRPADRALVRLNMIASADGGSTVSGVSGGLGNKDDHAVFRALRATADVVLVGMSTVVAERYRPTDASGPEIYVVSGNADISGNPDLFASGRATLVLPEDASPPSSMRVPVLRAGRGAQVDLARVVGELTGKVVLNEGGPTLAGAMVSAGLIDQFFLSLAPRVIAGASARVVHGADADPSAWDLEHGFVDDEGYLFLRYAHHATATTADASGH
jgi:5-amino-6-(5-phosphoribosylamino)uracil reductase